ncbi:Eukaryotic translation initiation factor 4E type 2 [Gaertneriomyces sp. JEL0708]|nr:Eukaryotic translation initiation factor 4E type 2 [Gaertneriomyces sp. JEL0708]
MASVMASTANSAWAQPSPQPPQQQQQQQQRPSNNSNSNQNNSSFLLSSDDTNNSTSNASTTEIPSSLSQYPLKHPWVFWFMHREPGSKLQDYTSALTKIATLYTLHDFWGCYSRMRRPFDLTSISDYHLFKLGVKPVWEDNLTGGKWIVRLKKGLASRYWESLVMAMVGDQFDVGNEICGAVVSIRHSEDILSLWNKSADDGRVNLRIRDTLKRVLNLPPNCIMEYKAHKSSVADNSSFRNTEMFR